MNFHEWTNENGEVLILRRIPQNRLTNGNGKGRDFIWPIGVGSVVTAPDWKPTNKCGHGLHGWPWGFGLGDGCNYDIINDVWLVIGVKPNDIVGEIDGGAKCKFRSGTIRMEGQFGDAMKCVAAGFMACAAVIAKMTPCNDGKSTVAGNFGKSTVAGDYGKSTVAGNDGQSTVAGDNGQSTVAGNDGKSTVAGDDGKSTVAGDYGKSTVAGDNGKSTVAGNCGQSTVAGDYGQSTVAGDYGQSTVAGDNGQSTVAGDYGQSTVAGNCGSASVDGMNGLVAIAGTGRVRVGPRGAFAVAYYTNVDGWRFLTGKVGEAGIEADTWYVVLDGRLTKEQP